MDFAGIFSLFDRVQLHTFGSIMALAEISDEQVTRTTNMKCFNEAKRNLVAGYLGFRAAIERDHQKAIKLCKRLRTFEDNEDTFAGTMLAYRYHDSGEDITAIHYGNQVLSVNPYDFMVLKLLIGIYFERNEYAVVYSYVVRALSVVPDPELEKMKGTTTRWLGVLIPWFRWVPKLRVLLPRVEQSLKDDHDYDAEWLRWAESFKEWYEGSLRSSENPLPPETA